MKLHIQANRIIKIISMWTHYEYKIKVELATMKSFNVTGLCIPEKNYMVDVSNKLDKIKEMIDKELYFTINRGRQYGKTTTIYLLEKMLSQQYIMLWISFEGIGDESFEAPERFCHMFMEKVQDALERIHNFNDKEYIKSWVDYNVIDFKLLNKHITQMCKGKKIVLMIDEVDKTSNNRVYLHFLGMLRDKYLLRNSGKDYTFQSVILAGVYDIKNIKLKMINDGTHIPKAQEGKIYNSPWNIASTFNVDMSFNPQEISTMLMDYEKDHPTGMDIKTISEEIYKYTSGYPFLVSRICQCLDEELNKDWSIEGVEKAVKVLLIEKNTLFDDIFKNIENSKNFYDLLYKILVNDQGNFSSFDTPEIELGLMLSILKIYEGQLLVSNIIFEIRIYNYLIQKNIDHFNENASDYLYGRFIKDDKLDMEHILRKFSEFYYSEFRDRDQKFVEREGRLLFLCFLKPIINGKGFYYVEPETRQDRRMDIVVTFGNEQFIIELKIWRGEMAKAEAYEQIAGYLDTMAADKGYMLTFDFRKNKDKNPKTEWIEYKGKKIFDVVM